MNRSKLLAISALLATAAILLGYVESLIPVLPQMPGIKLGLGNIAVVLALRLPGSYRAAWGVMLTKVLVCAALFTGPGALPYSLAGGVASLIVMSLLCRAKHLSCIGDSAAGGAAHMAAQTMVAALLTSTVEVLLLLPVLTAVGVLTGTANGAIANMTLNPLKRYFSNAKTKPYADS